jgi:hypothetical protein
MALGFALGRRTIKLAIWSLVSPEKASETEELSSSSDEEA